MRGAHRHLRSTGGPRPGFTTIELLITVAVVSVLAVVAASVVNLAPTEAEAAARQFAADAAVAQSLAINRPDLGCLIRLDRTTGCYWLARTSTPGIPVKHPVNQTDYVVAFSTGGRSGGVTFTPSEDVKVFDVPFTSLGGTSIGKPVSVTFTAAKAAWSATVDPVTGFVSVAESAAPGG